MTPASNRRNESTRAAILAAAFEMCVERGFAKTTVEGVAKRAGAGKQTIYRWWPSLAAVVLEAVAGANVASAEFPDTGDLAEDLGGQMRSVATFLASANAAPLKGLVAAAQSDRQVAEELLSTLIAPRVELCRKRLALAQEGGDLDPEVDTELVVELLYGPLYYRLLLRPDNPPSAEQVDQVIALALRAARAPERESTG